MPVVVVQKQFSEIHHFHVMKSADLDDSFDYLFKIVLIGDPGVGKTCIVQRFKKGTFVERHGSTIGVDFTMKTLVVDSKKVKVRTVFNKIKIAMAMAQMAPRARK